MSSWFGPSISIVSGSGAWSIGSVRASGAVGPEFEPTFCHSLLSGGPWQDLVSSVRLELLNCYGVVYHQERGVERSHHTAVISLWRDEGLTNCRHQEDGHHREDWTTTAEEALAISEWSRSFPHNKTAEGSHLKKPRPTWEPAQASLIEENIQPNSEDIPPKTYAS